MENALLRSLIAKRLPSIPQRDPEAAARAVYDACLEYARGVGMLDSEVALRAPGDERHYPGSTDGWTVVFEAGPYDWAIEASFFAIERLRVSAEPYYGFDLTFRAI
jgi:hypothetical protein